MKQYKKKYNVYSAWNYEQEVLALNTMSKKGWQLVCGKSFSHKYNYNPQVCYRYQLDYQPNLSEMGRYLETYREQGWEFINKTFNGWYYFRKVYDPSLTEDRYELYTDRTSLKEMNGRWAKIATLLSVILGAFFLFWMIRLFHRPCLPFLVAALTFGIEFAVMLRGALLMHNPDKPKAHKADCVFTALFFLTILCGGIATIALTDHRPYQSGGFHAEGYTSIPTARDEALQQQTFYVAYYDNYFLDVSISAESPVCFSVVDEDKNTVYSVTDSDFSEKDMKLRLKKGQYKIYLSDFDGGQLHVSCRLR